MPVEINDPSLLGFGAIEFVALSIRRPAPSPYAHVGLLYKNLEDQVRLSHLLWHCHFRGDDAPTLQDYWIEPHFNDIVLEQLAAFLVYRAEQEIRGEIPYSILRQGESFDEQGRYEHGDIGKGLTCATYILAAFEAIQIPLLDYSTWESGRPEDQQWFEEIIQLLAEAIPPVSEEHIAAQREALPNVVRFRPEEVAGAFSIFSDHPLTFEEVVPASLEARQFLGT